MIEDNCEELQRISKCLVSERPNVSSLINEALLSILKLKDDCHQKAFEAERLREETAKQRVEAEKTHLELQNKEYEKIYYEKEIQFSRCYKSKYTESQVDLVPEPVFFDTAPADAIKVARTSSRDLMKERLKFELQSRRVLLQKLEDVKKRSAQMQLDLQRRKNAVKQFYSYGTTLDDRLRPLIADLAPQASQTQAINLNSRLASLLPLPLYILYSQLQVMKNLHGLLLRVSISGLEARAAAYASEAARRVAEVIGGGGGGGGGGSFGGEKGGERGGGGTSTEAGMEQSGGPSTSPSLAPLPPSSASVAAATDYYETHPLMVVLELRHLPAKNTAPSTQADLKKSIPTSLSAPSTSLAALARPSPSFNGSALGSSSAIPSSGPDLSGLLPVTFMTVRFQFLTNLRVVTAQSFNAQENAALVDLVPGDNGSGSQIDAIQNVVKTSGYKFDGSRQAKPYLWCQRLCGMDFLPALAAIATASMMPTLSNAVADSEAEAQAVEGKESAEAISRDFLATGLHRYKEEFRAYNFIERVAAARGVRMISMTQSF